MDGLLIRSRAQLLDDALDAGPALDDASGAAQDDAVRSGLALAQRLRAAGEATAPVPTPEFREALRTRLLAVAAVQGVGATATAPPGSSRRSAVSWRQRAAAVGAGVMATVVAAGGVAVASSRSLPGDPFYGVKRTTEELQLRVADGAQEEGTRHLQFAATRLREVRALVLGREAPADAVADGTVTRDVEQRVLDTLADMDDDTRVGARLLTSSSRASRATEPLEELSRFASAQGDGLRAVLPALSLPGRQQAQQSLVLLQGVQAEAAELLMLLDCTAACDPEQAAPVTTGPEGAPPPCRCPAPVPAPQTAPVPPPSSGERPASPGPTAGPTSPTPAPAPSSPPPSPAPQPPPQQPLPVPVPLPSQPPLPTLPPVEPLAPNVQAPSPDAVLPDVKVPSLSGDGLLGAAPALVPGAGPLAVAVRVLVGWLR